MTGVEPAVGESRTEPRRSPSSGSTEQLVLAAAALLVGAQVIFRGWALYPSWFYTDDYRLLYDARSSGLTWAYLTAPFDSQFMPFGRLVAWVVAHAGDVNWTFAASLTLVQQGLAAAACLWMLCTVFGIRPAVLPLLGLYLTSAMTMPAMMWWAASLNQVPLQTVFFASVALGVRYLRTRRLRWLALTVLMLTAGLLCYVKVLLVVPVLAFLALAYWSAGAPLTRLLTALRAFTPAVLALGTLAAGYVAYYVTEVPQPFQDSARPVGASLANSMLGTSFVAGAWGGPWHWSASNPPVGYADPPDWALHLAWVLVVLVVLYGLLTRVRAVRAWVLLAAYALTLFLLVLTTRAPIAGGQLGLEYRYLTDVSGVLVLCLGLAFLHVPGAAESSTPRDEPLLAVRVTTPQLAVVVTLTCLLGLMSSVRYARIWHDDNPGDDYVHNVRAGLRQSGRVDLADTIVPAPVVPGFSYPYNTTRRLVPLIGSQARFPTVTPRLTVLAGDGTLHPALVTGTTTAASGPVPNCGWKVQAGTTEVPLSRTTPGLQAWMRIGYLASMGSPVSVTVADRTIDTQVHPGLHSLYIRTDQVFDHVAIGGLTRGATVCVDTIEVGDPTPAPGQLG